MKNKEIQKLIEDYSEIFCDGKSSEEEQDFNKEMLEDYTKKLFCILLKYKLTSFVMRLWIQNKK